MGAITLPYETVFHNLPREGNFCQGSSPVFPGYTFGKTWNGFASPYFTADTFMEICQYFSLVYGNESGEDLAECRCYYLPEDDAFYVEDYYDDYLRERIGTPVMLNTPSGPQKLYHFEACWDWVEVEERAIEMKNMLNWIVRKDDEIIDYVTGTKESVELYLIELQKDVLDSEYRADGCGSEFNENIKFKVLR